MRYQEALLISTVCCGIVFSLSSCESGLGDFQENQTYEYKLFDLLDKYPALHDTVHLKDPSNTQYRSDQCDNQQIRLDQCVVNALLGDVIDEHYEENTKAMAGQYVTIHSTQYPTQNTVQLMRHLIYRINKQNDLDNGLFNPETKRRETSALDYAAKFFSFLDDINDKNLNLGKELVTIMRAMSKFHIDKFDSALMRKEVEFANTDMDATPCQTATYNKEKCDHVLARHRLLTYQQTSVGKSNLQADYPIWLDNGGNLITHWENINSGDSKTNVGLGNAVQGNQSLMMAVFELVKDSDFRNNLYDLIRQLGVFLSGSVPKQPGSSERIKIADVAESLIRNIESYFTTGGEKATDVYSTNNDEMYSSGELRNTLRELQPGNTRLMLRSDRQNTSIIYEVQGKKIYPFDELLKSLKLIGWDPDNAHIEQSIEDIIKYDQYGRDRTDRSSCGLEDTSSCPHSASLLESLFFVTAAGANYGWTDSATDHVDGEKDQNGNDINYGHGHGNIRVGSASNPNPTKSGGISLNDNLYAMGTNKVTIGSKTYNLYQLALEPGSNPNYDHLFRSGDPTYMGRFTIDGDPINNVPSKDYYKFNFDQNYPGANFLAVGAAPLASRQGGKSKYVNVNGEQTPVLNSYIPFMNNVLENDNNALCTIDAAWHIVWNGAGPYYYDPEKAGKITEMVPCNDKEPQKLCQKYYRANGKLYALVYKPPQGPRSNNWEYIYPPNDDSEALYPIAFYYGKIDNPNTSIFTSSIKLNDENWIKGTGSGYKKDGSGIHFTDIYAFSISMGSITATVTLNNADYSNYISQDQLVNVINTAINSEAGEDIKACYPFGDDVIKIKNPYTGNIVLRNISGDAINTFLINRNIEVISSAFTVPLNAVKFDSPASVNITIDDKKYPVTFSEQEIWDRDRIILYLNEDILNNPYHIVPFGKDSIMIGGSPASSSKVIKIEKVGSGPNAVERLFNGNGTSIIREQDREERWNSINQFDSYMGYYYDYTDDKDKYSTVARDNSDNIKLINLKYYPPSPPPPTLPPNRYLYKVEASGISVQESIDDTDKSRACASQEEALFRNYQWFLNDKKFLLVIPLRQLSNGVEGGIVFQYIESNGYYGMSNSRPFRGNQLWAKTGKSGSSNIPGDYRIGMLLDLSTSTKAFAGLTGDRMFNEVLNGGPVFSSLLAQNINSLTRVAFPFSPEVSRGPVTWKDKNGTPHTDQITDRLVGSNEFTVGDTLWNRRNAFLPIFMALVNALRENTDYTRSNTTGLVPSFDMMTILLKPFAYYQKGIGDVPRNTWKFRVKGDGSTAYFLKSGADFYTTNTLNYNKPETWFGSWRERDYFQIGDINTLMSVLIDSNRHASNTNNRKLMDGILPLMVAENPDTHQRPKVLTQVFKILMNLTNNKFNDPPETDYNLSSQDFDKNFQSWGARRKLLYGLEQTSLLSKNTRGTFTTINDSTLTETLPYWMFTKGLDTDGDGIIDNDANNDGIPDDMRPEEIFANTDQNILVGSNDYTNDIKPGELGYQMGLAYLPHDWEKNHDKLTLFRKYLEMSSELLKPQGDYSVVENIINVLDKFFNQVSPTNDQVKGLVHTLGIMATTYNGKTWNVAEVPLTGGKISFSDHEFDFDNTSRVDDLYRVAAQYQPIINTITLALDTGVQLSFDERNGNQTNFNTSNFIFDSAVYFNALLKAGGLMEYVLDVVDTKDKFSEIFSELYAFLGEQLFKKFNSALWNDIAELMAGQVQVLTRNDSPTALRDKFQNFGFQYNDPN